MSHEPNKKILWRYALGQTNKAESAWVESLVETDPEAKKELQRMMLYLHTGKIHESEEESEAPIEQLENANSSFPFFKTAFILIIIIFLLLLLHRYIKSL